MAPKDDSVLLESPEQGPGEDTVNCCFVIGKLVRKTRRQSRSQTGGRKRARSIASMQGPPIRPDSTITRERR